MRVLSSCASPGLIYVDLGIECRVPLNVHIPKFGDVKLRLAIRASIDTLLGNSDGWEVEGLVQRKLEAHPQGLVILAST